MPISVCLGPPSSSMSDAQLNKVREEKASLENELKTLQNAMSVREASTKLMEYVQSKPDPLLDPSNNLLQLYHLSCVLLCPLSFSSLTRTLCSFFLLYPRVSVFVCFCARPLFEFLMLTIHVRVRVCVCLYRQQRVGISHGKPCVLCCELMRALRFSATWGERWCTGRTVRTCVRR